MGFAGTITHYGLKSMVNYSDATFMWEMDAGPGFSILTITNNSLIDNVFKNYGSVAQILWFCILIGCCLIIFTRNNKWEAGVICITLLALSLFIAIFECGARYLIQYLPYYIILSALGWSSFSAIMREKLICK